MSENTKKRIIDAALSLFKKRGFYEVSVRIIAKEAGISNGGFYHHFHSKDELLYHTLWKREKPQPLEKKVQLKN